MPIITCAFLNELYELEGIFKNEGSIGNYEI